jgi:membrane fusion protein, multidrug efflux system
MSPRPSRARARTRRPPLPVLLWALASLTPAFSGGCQEKAPAVAPPRAPTIPVSIPIPREVTDYVDFTGRVEAVHSVDIRSRVTGYLTKMPFREGAEVKAGDLLFEIDPRPYQAQYDSYLSQLNLYQAQLKLVKMVYARDVAINAKVPNSVSQQHLDQDYASVEEAEARVKSYERNMEVYKLNLEFTKVASPIDGQVSRYYLTLGNLVNQDSTLLTTVVSLDPMYAYFDLDEPTLLRIRKAINEGRIKRNREGVTLPVLMGLQGEEGFPHEGQINFFNNQLNPTTGSISVRGVFPNPEPKDGVRLLSPGMFVRIRLPIGTPRPSLLVIDRAVASDQGLKYVYVLDAKDKVQYRRVTTGAQQVDGLRAIDEGLKPDDRVVIGGLLQVRPRMTVQPDLVPMPTLTDRPSTGEPPDPSPREPGKEKGKGKGKAKGKEKGKGKAAAPSPAE